MDIDVQWGDKNDDEHITSVQAGIIDKAIALAKSRGLWNRYIYQNYAYVGQDVFAGYGQANRERLVNVSRKYDPERVFQRLQPGYFKI